MSRTPDLAADVEPREIREHEIEDHDVRMEDLAGAFSLLDGVALTLAGETHGSPHERVVVDHEHPHLLSIHTNSSK
jgi:hypothetical protein